MMASICIWLVLQHVDGSSRFLVGVDEEVESCEGVMVRYRILKELSRIRIRDRSNSSRG